jgi:broad specificity phosphatase PhoE
MTIRYSPDGQAARELARREEPAAEVILVRHGEPGWVEGSGMSLADPPLTEYGEAQAHCVAEVVAQSQPDAIYVSPLLRAQRTAAPLAEKTRAWRREWVFPQSATARARRWHRQRRSQRRALLPRRPG